MAPSLAFPLNEEIKDQFQFLKLIVRIDDRVIFRIAS